MNLYEFYMNFWEDNKKKKINQIYYHISTIELYFNNSQRNNFSCYYKVSLNCK